MIDKCHEISKTAAAELSGSAPPPSAPKRSLQRSGCGVPASITAHSRRL